MAILSDGRIKMRAETSEERGEIDAALAAGLASKMDVVAETPTENAIVTLDDEGNAQDSGVPLTAAMMGSQTIEVSGATCAADLAAGHSVILEMGANSALTITGPRTVDECLIFVQQDTEGSRLLTITGEVWAGGTAATLTATASAVDVIRAWTVDGWTTVYCEAVGLAFAAPA